MPRATDELAARWHELGEELATRVEAAIPGWVREQVRRILEAWTGDAPTRARCLVAAEESGAVVAREVGAELRALLAQAPEAQRATPVEIARHAVAVPTEILAGAGVPAVERDAFEQRRWPDDHYGLMIHSLAELGDPRLDAGQLEWGVVKAALLQSPGAAGAPGSGESERR